VDKKDFRMVRVEFDGPLELENGFIELPLALVEQQTENKVGGRVVWVELDDFAVLDDGGVEQLRRPTSTVSKRSH